MKPATHMGLATELTGSPRHISTSHPDSDYIVGRWTRMHNSSVEVQCLHRQRRFASVQELAMRLPRLRGSRGYRPFP
jgi:hypothetical protein